MVINVTIQYNGGFLPDIILYCWLNATNIGEPDKMPWSFSRIILIAANVSPPPVTGWKLNKGLDALRYLF